MESASEALPNNIEKLKSMLIVERSIRVNQEQELLKKDHQINYLLEQFRLAQQRQFGTGSESADQLGLFNEAEQQATQPLPVPLEQETVAAYTRNKPRRKPLPDHLPRKQIIHDLNDADKVCDCCGHDLHRMGEQTSEQLEFILASIQVIEHIRPKYSCRHCEQQGTETNIKIAPVPLQPIPRRYRHAFTVVADYDQQVPVCLTPEPAGIDVPAVWYRIKSQDDGGLDDQRRRTAGVDLPVAESRTTETDCDPC